MSLRRATHTFAKADNRCARWELSLSLLAYAAPLGTAFLMPFGPITVLAVLIGAIALARLYIIQHDCGHASFFETRPLNHNTGKALAILTLSSFNAMRFNHNLHHAHVGDLDRRDASEIKTWTLDEYRTASPFEQRLYRAYRHPITLFLIGPSLVFFLRYRWPRNAVKSGILDVVAHNLSLLGLLATLYLLGGVKLLIIWALTTALAASFGVFIVYLQHNFENTYWENHPDLDLDTAILKGSSVLDFGRLFNIATANIAYHDLHHLNARSPLYNLAKCHSALAQDLNPSRISFLQAIRAINWKLWDQDKERMVGFPSASA